MPSFSLTLTLKEAFETDPQLNKEVKWMEFDGVFCKKFKLLLDRFSSFFWKKVENQFKSPNVQDLRQSYSNGHFLLLFTSLPSACSGCMTWHVDFMRSKDVRKQLARTSLIWGQNTAAKRAKKKLQNSWWKTIPLFFR